MGDVLVLVWGDVCVVIVSEGVWLGYTRLAACEVLSSDEKYVQLREKVRFQRLNAGETGTYKLNVAAFVFLSMGKHPCKLLHYACCSLFIHKQKFTHKHKHTHLARVCIYDINMYLLACMNYV